MVWLTEVAQYIFVLFSSPFPSGWGYKMSKNSGASSDALSGESSMDWHRWSRAKARRGREALRKKSVSKGFCVIGYPLWEGPWAPRGLLETVCYLFPSLLPSFPPQLRKPHLSNWSGKDTNGDSSLPPAYDWWPSEQNKGAQSRQPRARGTCQKVLGQQVSSPFSPMGLGYLKVSHLLL